MGRCALVHRLNGISDAWLWGFDADGWRLRHGNPAHGMLGVLPPADGGPVATLDDALWLADACAFDHDAPVGVRPAMTSVWPEGAPKDPAAIPPAQPVEPFVGPLVTWYWDALNEAHGAASFLRFNDSYAIRYDTDDPNPGTNFSGRFDGRETLLAMYAMATRQADPLAEYLSLYRVLEGADMRNGTDFAKNELPNLFHRDFGMLRVMSDVWQDGESGEPLSTSVFDLYKYRARLELQRLAERGVTDLPAHLYQIRNSIAHGKNNILAGASGPAFEAAARALPIVKLLARVAVDPP